MTRDRNSLPRHHIGALQSDAVVNRNYIAANTDAHLGNPSHLTHIVTSVRVGYAAWC